MRLAFSGSWDEGLVLVNRAKMLNPVHPQWFSFPEVFYRYHRQEYVQALAVLDTIDMSGFFWVKLLQAASYGQLGRPKMAQMAVGELLELKPDFVGVSSGVIKTWQLGADFDRHIEQGLRKAGLELPLRP
jgi:hypothetical protein